MKSVSESTKLRSPFGVWLKARRRDSGYSLRELSEKAGGVCTGAYIGQLENNAYEGKKGKPMQPSEEIVEKLALALNASINEARLLADYKALNQSEEERIQAEFSHALHKYNRLSPKSRIFVNRHFSETINFLLDVEYSRSEPAPEKSSFDRQAIDLTGDEDFGAPSEETDEFNRHMETHLENVRQGNVPQPPLVADGPTEDEIESRRKNKIPKPKPKKKKSPPG